MDTKILVDLHSKELDVVNRKLYLYDSMTQFTALTMQMNIDLILNLIPEKQSEDITLNIGSSGGDLISFFAIHGLLNKYSPVFKMNAEVCGLAASAAALVFITTTGTRVMHKNSWLLLHPVSFTYDGPASNLPENTKLMKQLDNLIVNLLVKHSNKSADVWKKMIKSENYLDAEKCLEYGITDKII